MLVQVCLCFISTSPYEVEKLELCEPPRGVAYPKYLQDQSGGTKRPQEGAKGSDSIIMQILLTIGSGNNEDLLRKT